MPAEDLPAPPRENGTEVEVLTPHTTLIVQSEEVLTSNRIGRNGSRLRMVKIWNRRPDRDVELVYAGDKQRLVDAIEASEAKL